MNCCDILHLKGVATIFQFNVLQTNTNETSTAHRAVEITHINLLHAIYHQVSIEHIYNYPYSMSK